MSAVTASRGLTRPVLLAAGLFVLGSPAIVAHDEASAPPSTAPAVADAAASMVPLASTAPASPMTAYPALPAQVAVIPEDIPTVSVPPQSDAGTLVVGTPIEFTLGHCGLWSPVDVDGSLWEPVGGTDAAGGPIDTDAEIGELINATPGEIVLVAPDSAEFRSLTGVMVAFVRAPGELDYPLCM